MLDLCVIGLYVSLFIMAVLIYKIFASENVIVYNGVKYPVIFDYNAGRVYCRLFGNVARYIRNDNNYNIFGVVCEVI